jgi:hypothetical protein
MTEHGFGATYIDHFPGGSGDCLSRDQVGGFRLQLLAAAAVN